METDTESKNVRKRERQPQLQTKMHLNIMMFYRGNDDAGSFEGSSFRRLMQESLSFRGLGFRDGLRFKGYPDFSFWKVVLNLECENLSF